MNGIIQLDKQVFHFINESCHNKLFDQLMPFMRNANFWLPLYIFLLVFVLFNFKKHVFWWLFFAVGTVIISNFISSDLIKENFYRVRPCNDLNLANSVRVLVNYRPKSSSFTSSHATNHFAMAAFFYYTLKNYMGKWALFFFVWALVVGFAQVYVGVHFPLDVISGGLIGFVFGYLSARAFNKNYGLL